METKKEDTLNDEQIEAWRRIIFMRLEDREKGTGPYAFIIPKSEIIEYWRRVKLILEQFGETNKTPESIKPVVQRKKRVCTHQNSITGNLGKYCLDCEVYV